jgi:hypothetical protein
MARDAQRLQGGEVRQAVTRQVGRRARSKESAIDGPKPARKLIGHFGADADVDDIVDAILATVPANERPAEDRENRPSKA